MPDLPPSLVLSSPEHHRPGGLSQHSHSEASLVEEPSLNHDLVDSPQPEGLLGGVPQGSRHFRISQDIGSPSGSGLVSSPAAATGKGDKGGGVAFLPVPRAKAAVRLQMGGTSPPRVAPPYGRTGAQAAGTAHQGGAANALRASANGRRIFSFFRPSSASPSAAAWIDRPSFSPDSEVRRWDPPAAALVPWLVETYSHVAGPGFGAPTALYRPPLGESASAARAPEAYRVVGCCLCV